MFKIVDDKFDNFMCNLLVYLGITSLVAMLIALGMYGSC